MPSRKQSAKFKIDEPIRYDELLAASSMAGLVSFLDLPTGSIGIPNEPPTKAGIPTNQPAVSLHGISGIPNKPVYSSGIPKKPIPPVDVPIEADDQDDRLDLPPSMGIPIELGGPAGIPNARYAQLIEARRLRPFRLTLVQDGHSRNEQAIYEALWKDGRQLAGQAAKSVQIGYGELARKARVSRNSVIRLLASLEKKFSIARENREATQAGSWYTVFDYTTILEARQKAGLLWAVKDRNGVLLLTRDDVVTPHLRSLGIPDEGSTGIPNDRSTGIPKKPATTLGMPSIGIPGIPTEGIPGIPNEPPYPKYVREAFSKDVVVDLIAEIRKQTDSPPWDSSAAQLLWERCTEKGIATVAELMYFFHKKWQTVRQKRNTVNPVGLMAKAVPESISTEALADLRREWTDINRRDAQPGAKLEAASLEAWIERHRAVLNDPGASEQEKKVATAALSHNARHEDE